jgi:excisionase family DNA binding protein
VKGVLRKLGAKSCTHSCLSSECWSVLYRAQTLTDEEILSLIRTSVKFAPIFGDTSRKDAFSRRFSLLLRPWIPNLTEFASGETFHEPTLCGLRRDKQMTLAEIVGGKKEALRVAEIARILNVSVKTIYRMAAKGQIPSFKTSHTLRFDPQDTATWLRSLSETNSAKAVSLLDRAYLKKNIVPKQNRRRYM